MTTLEALARESFLVDVTSVGEELTAATHPDRFALLLAELVELCTRDRRDGSVPRWWSEARKHLFG